MILMKTINLFSRNVTDQTIFLRIFDDDGFDIGEEINLLINA